MCSSGIKQQKITKVAVAINCPITIDKAFVFAITPLPIDKDSRRTPPFIKSGENTYSMEQEVESLVSVSNGYIY